MKLSKDLINHLEDLPLEVQAAMDPSRDISTLDNLEFFNAVYPPQGSSDSVNNNPESTVTPAAIQPQDLSTSEFETVCLDIENPSERISLGKKFSSNSHAISIVYILNFYGCKVGLIHAVLESYGFKCSLRAVVGCIYRYKFFSHDKIEHPVNGTEVDKKTYPSKKESIFTAIYVNDKPTVFTHQFELLQAYTPLYKQLVCGLDGRELIVELTDGQIQVRVFDHPDPRRNEFLVNRRMVCQHYQGTWDRFKLGLF